MTETQIRESSPPPRVWWRYAVWAARLLPVAAIVTLLWTVA